MFRKSLTLSRLLLFAVCFLFFLASCKERTSPYGDRPSSSTPPPSSSEAPSRPTRGHYAFPVIDTTSLFIGTIGVDDFVIFVDSSDGTRLQGHYLPLVDTVADTVAFCLTTNGRKLWLSYKDEELVLRPRDLAFVDGHYQGVVRMGMFRSTRFDFYPLELPDFQYYDDSRYREPQFSVETVTDVPYASVNGYWDELASEAAVSSKIFNMGKAVNERPLDLKLDVYLPKDDTLHYRPTVMLAHGGAFYFGAKDDLSVVRWCKHLASLGYVAVSIDYRLGFVPSKNAIVRAGYRAAQDAHAAMRYLVSERETYGIDTSMLFVGGSSAGAIATMSLVYMTNETRPAVTYGDKHRDDLGAIDTCGNDLRCDFNVKGIVDMWGAIPDTAMMQGHREPILAFHGDADDIVPYGYDYPFGLAGAAKTLFVDKMYGSSCIVDHALQSGAKAKMVTFIGFGHAPHLSIISKELNDNFYIIQDTMTQFFYDIIGNEKPQLAEERHGFVVEPDLLKCSWHVEGGVPIATDDHKVRVVWIGNAPEQSIIVSGALPRGIGYNDTLFFKKSEVRSQKLEEKSEDLKLLMI